MPLVSLLSALYGQILLTSPVNRFAHLQKKDRASYDRTIATRSSLERIQRAKRRRDARRKRNRYLDIINPAPLQLHPALQVEDKNNRLSKPLDQPEFTTPNKMEGQLVGKRNISNPWSTVEVRGFGGMDSDHTTLPHSPLGEARHELLPGLAIGPTIWTPRLIDWMNMAEWLRASTTHSAKLDATTTPRNHSNWSSYDNHNAVARPLSPVSSHHRQNPRIQLGPSLLPDKEHQGSNEIVRPDSSCVMNNDINPSRQHRTRSDSVCLPELLQSPSLSALVNNWFDSYPPSRYCGSGTPALTSPTTSPWHVLGLEENLASLPLHKLCPSQRVEQSQAIDSSQESIAELDGREVPRVESLFQRASALVHCSDTTSACRSPEDSGICMLAMPDDATTGSSNELLLCDELQPQLRIQSLRDEGARGQTASFAAPRQCEVGLGALQDHTVLVTDFSKARSYNTSGIACQTNASTVNKAGGKETANPHAPCADDILHISTEANSQSRSFQASSLDKAQQTVEAEWERVASPLGINMAMQSETDNRSSSLRVPQTIDLDEWIILTEDAARLADAYPPPLIEDLHPLEDWVQWSSLDAD